MWIIIVIGIILLQGIFLTSETGLLLSDQESEDLEKGLEIVRDQGFKKYRIFYKKEKREIQNLPIEDILVLGEREDGTWIVLKTGEIKRLEENYKEIIKKLYGKNILYKCGWY